MSFSDQNQINKRRSDFNISNPKRRIISGDNDDNVEIDPNIKRYLDAKFEDLKSEMLNSFEKQMQGIFKHFGSSNRQLTSDVEFIKKSTEQIQSTVDQCISLVEESTYRSPSQTQVNQSADSFIVTPNKLKIADVRCPPLSVIIYNVRIYAL